MVERSKYSTDKEHGASQGFNASQNTAEQKYLHALKWLVSGNAR